jgi:hypothetical protein
MLRNISTTLGSAMAALCLVSTLAMAQPQTTTQDKTTGWTIALRQSEPMART